MKVGGGGLQALIGESISPVKRIDPAQNKKDEPSLFDPGINKPVPTKDELIHAVEEMNHVIDLVNKDLKFKLHEETERIMVKVLDRDSGEILKEIPPEELLDMLVSLKEAVGIFIDKYV